MKTSNPNDLFPRALGKGFSLINVHPLVVAATIRCEGALMEASARTGGSQPKTITWTESLVASRPTSIFAVKSMYYSIKLENTLNYATQCSPPRGQYLYRPY
jgi:hypothetical protein